MTRTPRRTWSEQRADGKAWYTGAVVRDFSQCPMPTCRSQEITRWSDKAHCQGCDTWIEYREGT